MSTEKQQSSFYLFSGVLLKTDDRENRLETVANGSKRSRPSIEDVVSDGCKKYSFLAPMCCNNSTGI